MKNIPASPAAGAVASSEAVRRRGLLFIRLASAGVGFALVLQMTLNSNFLVGEIHATGLQVGFMEAVRESCGIIAFALLALLAGIAEPLIGSIVLLLVWLGLSAYAFTPSYGSVMLMSVVWSQGLHLWMPLPNSMTLALAEPGRAGARLGQVQAAHSLGSWIGLALAFALTLAGVRIRPLYLFAGGAACLAAAACLGIPRRIRTPGPSLVFRRRYLTYYALNFLEGWRKQVSLCFAGFLLVKNYRVRLLDMIVLWALIQSATYFASPAVGRLIDRAGEKRVLTIYYAAMILAFIGYAFVPNLYILYSIFVIDGAFFTFATALTTYVNRIAPPGEHTPTLSMGVAMNHIAAVVMPFVGGILWNTLGYRWSFMIGIPAAMASIVIVRRLVGRSEPDLNRRAAPVEGQ
jgi:predicted MFS family arabinose efflux permease